MFDIFDFCGITQVLENISTKLGIKSKEYHSEQIAPKKYSYRPQTLEQYIGQENAKELVKLNIKKIKTMKAVHFVISGTRGHGKSTLAYIISNMLNFDISTYVGGSFTKENLQEFLVKNADAEKPQILFIDETHGLDKKTAEFMYPLLEDFILPVGNIKVRPFVFVGATTDKNILLKKFAPLVDRCGCQLNLEHYLAEDIKSILKQYNDQLYQKNITEEVYDILAVNSRFNPRTSIAMLEDFIVSEDINRVLNAHRVVKSSLTTDDILILKHLVEIDKPVGVETLAIIIQQTKQDYLTLAEPFLLQQGYLTRTARGRIATIKGKQLLTTIKEQSNE
jgi:Holliday junction DNA helicase RuvB